MLPRQVAGIGHSVAAANPVNKVIGGRGVWFGTTADFGKDVTIVEPANASQTTIYGNFGAPFAASRDGGSSLAGLDSCLLSQRLSAAAGADAPTTTLKAHHSRTAGEFANTDNIRIDPLFIVVAAESQSLIAAAG